MTTRHGRSSSKAKKFRIRITGFEKKAASAFQFNPLNWRRHGDAQRDALRTMLGDVGWVQGVIENKRTGNLIDGHARIEEALREDPDQEVPYLVVDLSLAEEQAVLATLDPIGAMAEVDPVMLDQLYKQTVANMPGLEELLNSLHGGGAANGDLEKLEDGGRGLAQAAALTKKWHVKTGDQWSIGDHRLICGDATNPLITKKLAGAALADLCFTSPPYLAQRHYDQEITDWDLLMRGAFGAAPLAASAQILVNLGLIYRAGEWVQYWDQWIQWMRDQGWRRFGWYVWDQGPGLMGDWHGRAAPSHEFIFHFNREAVRLNKTQRCKHAGERHPLKRHGLRGVDGEVKAFSHRGRAIQEFKIADSVFRVIRAHDSSGLLSAHPAQFPIAFALEIIGAFSAPGAIVYEPFAGSGTSLVACETLGRKCIAADISAGYVAVTLERMRATFPKLKIEKVRP